MDPVDILTFSVHAAQLIRSGADPEAIIRGAYGALELARPNDEDDPLALRIARLSGAAGPKRDELMSYLQKCAGPLPLNRPKQDWGGAVAPAAAEEQELDEEAEELVAYADEEQDSAREMLGEMPAFSVAERSISVHFGGRTIIVRDGERLTVEEAGDVQAGDSLQFENEGLPSTVRGLIDYPLETPCLFTIDVGNEPWSVWDICCAFADQYARIYEHPEKYGVWGHDISDLWIERLLYFPEKRIIYPHVGS